MKENKLIYSQEFSGNVGVTMSDDEIRIGCMSIGYDHDQDCCERVYADFSTLEHHLDEINKKCVSRVEIKAVEDIGIIIFFYPHASYEKRIGVLIGCHNEQNGYYSSNMKKVFHMIFQNIQKYYLQKIVSGQTHILFLKMGNTIFLLRNLSSKRKKPTFLY